MVARRRGSGCRSGLFAIAAFLCGFAASAPAAPHGGGAMPDQRRTVAGWRIENVAEEDGGRLVRMTHAEGRYRLVYAITFWRGNAGPYAEAAVDLPDHSCGQEEWRRDPAEPDLWRRETNLPAGARAVRARLTLETCGLAPHAVARMLRGFDAAFALTSRWAELARRDTLAEVDRISRNH